MSWAAPARSERGILCAVSLCAHTRRAFLTQINRDARRSQAACVRETVSWVRILPLRQLHIILSYRLQAQRRVGGSGGRGSAPRGGMRKRRTATREDEPSGARRTCRTKLRPKPPQWCEIGSIPTREQAGACADYATPIPDFGGQGARARASAPRRAYLRALRAPAKYSGAGPARS